MAFSPECTARRNRSGANDRNETTAEESRFQRWRIFGDIFCEAKFELHHEPLG
jgi:hypothetical protein